MDAAWRGYGVGKGVYRCLVESGGFFLNNKELTPCIQMDTERSWRLAPTRQGKLPVMAPRRVSFC